jgi:hypothetical protein
MTLRVGPYLYRVRYVEGYIDHEGQPCLGLCDNQAQVIYVSDQVSAAEQIQTLCHEYMEAWIYHFGQGLEQTGSGTECGTEPGAHAGVRPGMQPGVQPGSGGDDLMWHPRKEAWCDLFGMAMTQFIVDWMHQVRRFAGQADAATMPDDGPPVSTGNAPQDGVHVGPHATARAAGRPCATRRRKACAPPRTPARAQTVSSVRVRERFTSCQGPRQEAWRVRIFEGA